MESSLNYLTHSTELTTPTGEFEADAAINSIDLIIDNH